MAVMVWIHGGAFSFGSSTGYYGGVLAALNDVIVVSINYRVGVLGFFNVPGTGVKGNYGMLDQVETELSFYICTCFSTRQNDSVTQVTIYAMSDQVGYLSSLYCKSLKPFLLSENSLGTVLLVCIGAKKKPSGSVALENTAYPTRTPY